MPNHDELSEVLVDVRKAYRLLNLFQGRVLDLADLLAKRLGQEFFYWLCGSNEVVGAKENPCEISAWMMLPLNRASFMYLPAGVVPKAAPKRGEWLLEFQLSPDVGGSSDREDGLFKSPEQCDSKIYLYALVVQKNLPGKSWWDLYYDLEWPAKDRVAKQGNLALIRRSCDLTSLADHAAIDSLANEFREQVRKQGGRVIEPPTAAASGAS